MTLQTHIRVGLVMLLACMLAISLAVPTAQAQTTTQMQLQINQLLAQIAALQAQLTGSQGAVSTSGMCPYAWSRNLSVGDSGADVLKLQQFLNSNADTRVALSGAGSPGSESQFFGPLTAAAVSKFQTKYRSEVLTPSGLVNPTGFFGPSSRTKINALCVSAPTTPQTPTTPTTPSGGGSSNTSDLHGEEALIDRFKTSSGDDTNLEEKQRNAEVMDVEFRVRGGDIRITRVDVAFDHVVGDENDPWDVFSDVSLRVDGKQVARMAVDDDNDWSEDDPYNGAHRIRFTGLNIIVREGDRAQFTVAASVQNSVDGADDGLSFDVFIPTNGIRVRDSEGSDQYIGSNNETVNVDINEEGSDDELAIKSSENDPDSTTFQLNRNKKSNWITVFAFDLDTDDSVNDIEVRELPVALTVSAGTVGTYLSDARLKIGNNTYDDVTITDGATNNMVFNFDKEQFVIDAGDRVPVEVQIEFKSLSAGNEGVTIQGSANSTNIEAEGADDLSATQLSGAATGDVHSLRTNGSTLGFKSATKTLKANSPSDQTDDEGIFEVTFNVTAFGSDIFVNESAASGTIMSTEGVNYILETSGNVQVTDGTVSAALSSTADEVSSGRFRVSEGKTASFTLTVVYDPATSGFYRLQLYSINYATSNTDPTIQQRMLPASRYQTASLSI